MLGVVKTHENVTYHPMADSGCVNSQSDIGGLSALPLYEIDHYLSELI